MHVATSQSFLQIATFAAVTQDEAHHGFGTRVLSDDVAQWAKHLAIQPEQLVTLKQTHSNTVVVVDDTFDFTTPHEGDALITNRTDVVLSVKTADCLPVLIFDPVKKVVAAVHAGWRGLVQQVIIETLEVMNHNFGVEMRDVHVAFGPCLQGTHFEVGAEVVEMFRQELGSYFYFENRANGKALIDMHRTAAMGLEQLGLYAKNFYFLPQNTLVTPELFHSYRRDKEQAGRQLNFIRLI